MTQLSKPVVYISYTWLYKRNERGEISKEADDRTYDLAEKLREAGIDSRLDKYFSLSLYGFSPPSPVVGDKRDPWLVWSEEQIKESDCVILFCTPDYTASDSGDCPGEWCSWHQLDEVSRLNERRPALWWDWHFMAKQLETGAAQPRKFIPVGFGPYFPLNIPGFIRGANYYDLNSEKDFQGLLRRIKSEYQIKHPRQGVFISYSHDDESKWLELLLRHLNPLKKNGMEIWTDRDIPTGAKWHESIQNALQKAMVAVLMVTPSFLESDYISNHELTALLQAAESEGLIIFWIPVKPSSYKETEIAQFQAAHNPDKPLSGLRGAKLEQSFVDIASRLKDSLMAKNSGAV